jgi:dTDP-4-dehydrorhamnose reductase
MKVIVTGASGLLGRAIMKAFAQEDVLGLALSRTGESLSRLDLTDRVAINDCVGEFSPDVVIHSAAIRKPDICENDPDLTHRLNVDSTRWIAEAAKECGAWVLYISTDYVFDGTAPPYSIDARPNPLNIYGQSKLDGEKALLEVSPDNGVLRVPILYGPVEYMDESAITVIARQVSSGNQSQIDHWATRYPTHVDDVASACLGLTQAWIEENEQVRRGGIFHFSGDEPMTKADMAAVIGEVLGLDTSHLEPSSSPPPGAPRPRDCCLDCSRIEGLFDVTRTPFEDGIREILADD